MITRFTIFIHTPDSKTLVEQLPDGISLSYPEVLMVSQRDLETFLIKDLGIQEPAEIAWFNDSFCMVHIRVDPSVNQMLALRKYWPDLTGLLWDGARTRRFVHRPIDLTKKDNSNL